MEQTIRLNLDTLHQVILEISNQKNLQDFWRSVCKNAQLLIDINKICIFLIEPKEDKTKLIIQFENGQFIENKYLEYSQNNIKNLINLSKNNWMKNYKEDKLLKSLFKDNDQILVVPIEFDSSNIGLIIFSLNNLDESEKDKINSITKIYSLHIGMIYKYMTNKLELEVKNQKILDDNLVLEKNYLNLEQSSEIISRSEKQFRLIADSIPNLVWTADPQGNMDYFNKHSCEYYQKTCEELQKGEWKDKIYEEDLINACEFWQKSLETKEIFQRELRIKNSDGQYRWFLVRAIYLVEEDNQINKWFGTCTDIQQQKENEDKINASNQELQQFAYIASHDLQEPLRTISGYTSLLAKRYKTSLDEEATEFVDFITEGTQRMQIMINDLLEYSRVGGNEAFKLHQIDLNEIVKQVTKNLELAINEKNAVITYEKLPVLPTRESLMTLLFQNLINNSIKYNESENPKIEINCKKSENEYIFSISDNGIGIESQYLNKIFQIFKRLHTRDKYTGTGIGLAICKKIVEKHGGNIWVESEYNVGTTFYFTLKV